MPEFIWRVDGKDDIIPELSDKACVGVYEAILDPTLDTASLYSLFVEVVTAYGLRVEDSVHVMPTTLYTTQDDGLVFCYLRRVEALWDEGEEWGKMLFLLGVGKGSVSWQFGRNFIPRVCQLRFYKKKEEREESVFSTPLSFLSSLKTQVVGENEDVLIARERGTKRMEELVEKINEKFRSEKIFLGEVEGWTDDFFDETFQLPPPEDGEDEKKEGKENEKVEDEDENKESKEKEEEEEESVVDLDEYFLSSLSLRCCSLIYQEARSLWSPLHSSMLEEDERALHLDSILQETYGRLDLTPPPKPLISSIPDPLSPSEICDLLPSHPPHSSSSSLSTAERVLREVDGTAKQLSSLGDDISSSSSSSRMDLVHSHLEELEGFRSDLVSQIADISLSSSSNDLTQGERDHPDR